MSQDCLREKDDAATEPEDDAAVVADWKVQRDEAKAAGDAAFRVKNFGQAIAEYTTALSVDPDNAKILSNRSAAYLLNGQKSKAFHDAQKCVSLGDMGIKGQSRLAAALQALGRWETALNEWQSILKLEPQYAAALKGVSDCRGVLDEQEQQKEKEQDEKQDQQQTGNESKGDGGGDDKEVDDLDNFFNDVEEATEAVVRQKEEEAATEPSGTEAIKNHKKDLGTAKEQIERLLAPNYKWRNLNPFFVLDISHNASEEEVSRRYKALSLLLHPDKNRDDPKAQDAYDQVLQAKAKLQDENKANHARQLVEQGMKQGKLNWELNMKGGDKDLSSLSEFQSKAVQRIFAQIEQKRREVEERHRKQEQREREQEEQEQKKERDERKFDKSWKQEGRVDKRIGNWRDFQKGPKASKKSKTS